MSATTGPQRPGGGKAGPKMGGRTLGVAMLGVAILGALLASLLPGRGGGAAQPAAGANIDGRALYRQYCASCHGANLQGQPNWQAELPTGGRPAPPHDETGHTWHHSDKELFEITKYGGQRFSDPGYRNFMPAYEGQLSDEQITAIIDYIKSRWPAEIREAQASLNK